ncbi:MAG: glycosyltransferase family 4 protein [Acidimicrobiia bacterium]
MTSLLVTNDFPPKIGGIQSYLHELWRRLPPESTHVLTTTYPGAGVFDRTQELAVERYPERVLLPTRALARHVDARAAALGAGVVFLDPMLPLGRIGSRLTHAPHVIVGHGAEVTVYGRVPGSHALSRSVLRGAAGLVAAGEHVARIAARVAGGPVPTLVVPPGVDPVRFVPLDAAARRAARVRFGLDPDRPLVLGVSRLVPRKGFDVLLDAVAGLDPDVQVAIAGGGRDRERLDRHAERLGPRAHMLGRVSDADLPALYGCADVFAMLCRDRWGGLEAEGFGIVFVEAGACGVPSVAGHSGGSHEAVVDGETGFVVEPRDVVAVRGALDRLLRDDARRERMGAAARARAATELSYDALAARLAPLAAGDLGVLRPLD